MQFGPLEKSSREDGAIIRKSKTGRVGCDTARTREQDARPRRSTTQGMQAEHGKGVNRRVPELLDAEGQSRGQYQCPNTVQAASRGMPRIACKAGDTSGLRWIAVGEGKKDFGSSCQNVVNDAGSGLIRDDALQL